MRNILYTISLEFYKVKNSWFARCKELDETVSGDSFEDVRCRAYDMIEEKVYQTSKDVKESPFSVKDQLRILTRTNPWVKFIIALISIFASIVFSLTVLYYSFGLIALFSTIK